MSILNFLGALRKRKSVVGKWRMVHAQGAVDSRGAVDLEFFADGLLEYRIHEKEKLSIIKLVYELHGNEIVTDQPSSPRSERTRFQFDSSGRLVLSTETSCSWFERVDT